MVYASTHLSLATLEILVHVNNVTFLESRTAIRFEIDDGLLMHLDEEALPMSWDALPAPVSAQKSGDAWASSKQSMVLVVPSAVLPNGNQLEERNLLLNPNHADFLDQIRNVQTIPFSFNGRIADLVELT